MEPENQVPISGEDEGSQEETLYLLALPGMRESIRGGLETPIEECCEDPGW